MKQRRNLALLSLLGSMCMSTAWAEGPCPQGQRMVGQQNRGGAVIPICQPFAGLESRPSGPRIVWAERWGAYAINGDRAVSWAVNHDSMQEAEKAAMASCAEGGNGSCRSLGGFSNACMAYAIDMVGNIAQAQANGPDAAESYAIKKCNETAVAGRCVLLSRAICAGDWFNPSINDRAKQASTGDLEKASAQGDNRKYWGAIASSGNQVKAAYDLSNEAAAKTAVLATCDGCRVIKTFENSCAGIAWPADNRPLVETAVDKDPATAKSKAQAQCTSKYGNCDAALRCSGRAYPKNNPDAS